MNNACSQDRFFKDQERGAARLKFIVLIAVIAIVAYVGYQYIPVAYQASAFKRAMQADAVNASGRGQVWKEWLQDKIKADAKEYDVPPNAEVTIERSAEGRIQVRVKYTRPIVLLGYTYLYNFDYTAKSTDEGL